jgi:hypothetical protein
MGKFLVNVQKVSFIFLRNSQGFEEKAKKQFIYILK